MLCAGRQMDVVGILCSWFEANVTSGVNNVTSRDILPLQYINCLSLMRVRHLAKVEREIVGADNVHVLDFQCLHP